MHQNRALSPSALILSLAQRVTGCGSKCPRLQFRQSELSVFQCFDGSPGSGHLSAPLSLHHQPAVGGMTHTKTHSLSLAPAFSAPLKKEKKTIHTDSYLWHARLPVSAIQMQMDDLFEEYFDNSVTLQLHSEKVINHVA